MQAVFAKILNMSLTGSIVIAVVLLTRLFLKRAPKIYSYALWAVVLFRLLCPLSITAGLSVLKPLPVTTTPGISTVSYQSVAQSVQENTPAPIRQQVVPAQTAQTDTKPSPMQIAAYIWAAGASVMVAYSIAQYGILRRKLADAVPLREEIYLTDRIASPFVMGVFRPRIYLPSSTPMAERRFIVAHERHHIRRGDPLWKLLGYCALCLHWFNPLVWLAFVLAGKDMEMSCDEAVIKRLGEHIRADYSQALLRLATHKRMVSGMPLAFGEGDTKGRVMNMAKWKKPKVWVSLICLLLCIAILVACAVNPETADSLDDMHAAKILGEITAPNALNIREKPKSTSAVVDNYPSGEIVTILETKNGWGRTDKGWISMDFITTIGGVMAFPIPENFSADNWDWLHELELPEWQDKTLGYSAGGAPGGMVTVEFFSDVPEGQERTVLNEHNLYFYEGWIYDLWFDKLTVKPEVMDAILDSVSVGEEKAIPVVDMPYTILEMPAGGYDYRTEADGSVTFRKGDSIVGGIVTYAIPEGVYDPNDTIFLWLEDVGIPDFEDKSLVYMGGISDFTGGWSAEFASNVPEGVEPTVKRRHHFNVVGDIVYDFWLDQIQLDQSAQFAFADAVLFVPPVSEAELERTGRRLQTELTFYVEGLEETLPATLYIGEGYSLYIPNDEWTHYTGNLDYQPVQTWESHDNPEVELQILTLNGMTLTQAQEWIKDEFSDYTLIEDNRGGLGGTDAENNMADIRFVASGDAVYAICCLYPMEAAEGFGARLSVMADTFALTVDAPVQDLTPEEAAFAKCFAVMDSAQDGSVHIRTDCEFQNTPGDNYIEDFYYGNELGMLKIIHTAGSETHAELYANHRYFTNEGNWTGSELIWKEQSGYEGSDPWLGSFYFIKHYVTYMDTLTDEAGESCMFRVDAPFEDREEATPYYFVNFDFDKQGNFLRVCLQINPVQDNAYTLTESIVSRDEQEIASKIDREYQRAIGS